MNETLINIGDTLDQLCTLPFRPQGPDQAVVRRLYTVARERTGYPLTMQAATRLEEKIKPGMTVLLTTGAGCDDFLPVGETDGPPGTAALAAMLSIGLGAVPVIVTESGYVENIRATAVAAGLGIREFEVAQRVPCACTVVSFPNDDTAGKVALEYFRRFQPAAVIAIEKIGPNEVGIAHTATGRPASPSRAKVEVLFDLAAMQGILTVGIGDNGNGIGFGLIQEAVRKYKRFGAVCQCPCGRGLATRVATDVLVVAGTSNWGAYGIATALAARLGRPDWIHDLDAERRMLEECVRTGAADGSLGRHTVSVDGTPAGVQCALLELMRQAVTICLQLPRRRPF
jgi:hypothetical protein